MQKIPTLWKRDEAFRATAEVEPECAWVLEAETDASVKWDGTACLIHEGALYKHHRLKAGKPEPQGWLHWREVLGLDDAPATGHGWAPVTPTPEDARHLEAFAHWGETGGTEDGTYELCGPSVQGNPHGLSRHVLIRHGEQIVTNFPLTFEGMSAYLQHFPHEGVVWHHRDGRMAKVKRRDFSLPWPIKD